MIEFDPGPPPAVAAHLAEAPSPTADQRRLFWYDWGPIFYRGRLDTTARVLCIASDPGPTERIAARTLVGDAGQRVQGFLSKLGLTRSYVCVNAYAYGLLPSKARFAAPVLAAQTEWRNALYSMITGSRLQAIVAFGGQAQDALALWTTAPPVAVEKVPHPSSRDPDTLLDRWRQAVERLRPVVAKDPDGTQNGPNYGATFTESDYAAVPARDLPFGVPPWLGDDAWGRLATPRHNNSVRRPSEDLIHTLVWQAPPDQQ